MKGHKVSDDENVICTANGRLEDQEQQFFYNRMRTLEKPWTKCISAAGDLKSYAFCSLYLVLGNIIAAS